MTRPEDKHRSDRLWQALRRDLDRETGMRAWLRARRTRTRLAYVCATSALLAVLVVLATPRSDFDAVPGALLALSLGVLAAAMVAIVVLLLRPLYCASASVRTQLTLAAAGWLIPFLLVLWAPAHGSVLAHPESFVGAGANFWPRALVCFAFGVVLGLPLLALLRLVDRGGELTWPRILLLAGATGLAGNLALVLHCPLVAPTHLLAGHASVPVGTLLLLLIVRGRRARP